MKLEIIVRFICFSLISIMLWGCSVNGVITKKGDIDDPFPPPPVLVVENNGSLWRASDGSNLFTDQDSWKEGDIITVIISETAKASKSAATKTSRTTGLKGGVSGFLSPTIMDNVFGPSPGTLLGADFTSSHDGKGTTSRQENLEARISAVVKRVMPNGNLYVEGKREVTVNDETQVIEISGYVRKKDIQRGNTILSAYLADASIKYYGSGVLSDRQQAGWLTRIIDWLRPL